MRGAEAFAIDGTHALVAEVRRGGSRLTVVDLATGDTEVVTPTDEDGQVIRWTDRDLVTMVSRPVWGRGNRLYVLDSHEVWALDVPTCW